MAGSLAGRVAIVTGTSRGVGVGISRRLLEAGATVIGCARRAGERLPAAEGLEGADERSAQWTCDQRDLGQIDAFVDRVIEAYGHIDILVNNAGGTIPAPHAEAIPPLVARWNAAPESSDEFERTALFHQNAIQQNLTSPLWFSLRVARQMLRQEGTASIVNISSGASHAAGSPTLVSYGAAKAGLNHMTKSLAQEWGPRIRVNCLALGPTMTEGFQRMVLGKEGGEEEYYRHIPIRRAGDPLEVGSAVVFLCGEAAQVINGATIEMDGGMSPGSLYEAGLAPIQAMLEAAEPGGGAE